MLLCWCRGTSKSFMVLQSVISEVLPAVVREIDALLGLSSGPSEQVATDNRARLLRYGNAPVETQCRSRYSFARFLYEYGHLQASTSTYTRRAVQSNRFWKPADVRHG